MGSLEKVKMKNNKLIIGSVVVIALSIAYYLLAYLPKQQEISLRRQVYELCLKETNSNKAFEDKGYELMTQYGKEEGIKMWGAQREIMIQSCVEKRLQEYKK